MDKAHDQCCPDSHTAKEKGRRLADDILTNGKNSLLDDEPVLLPPWYDHHLVTRGQEYFSANIFNMFVAALSGLLALLTVPSILKVLTETNLSSNPPKAYKRYVSTINHMVTWYQSDMRNPNSKGRQSILIVRKKHAAASRTKGPITQSDLALTQFGFIGLAVVGCSDLGLPLQGQTGLIHFWRVIGHLMGIEDRFNLMQGCPACTEVACREMSRRVFGPGLDQPPDNFKQMAAALLDGVWPIVPMMNKHATMELTRRLCGQPPQKLPFFPQIVLHFQIFIHKLLKLQFLAIFLVPYFNFQIWLTLLVQKTVPVLAFIAFKDYWTH